MTAPLIGWRGGEPSLHRRVERALAKALDDPQPIHTSERRTLHRLMLPPIAGEDGALEGIEVVCKLYHRRHGVRRLREVVKRRISRSSAQREWNALLQATERDLPVPEPLAYGRISSNEEVLVTRFEPGRPLLELLEDTRACGPDLSRDPWSATCSAIAHATGALHQAGMHHGDLHAGNLRLGERGIVLLDLQRARPLRSEAERLLDLAQLEYSLARSGATPEMRATLRRALGVGAELDRAMARFVRDHRRGRARRRLRIGRDWQRITIHPDARGTMLRRVDPGLVQACFSSIDPDAVTEAGIREIRRTERVLVHELRAGDRRVVTKRVRAGSPLRALADRFRGSAAARAFRRGGADRLISHRAAPALAYVDLLRKGWPVESWLLMERVGEEDLDALVPVDAREAQRITTALGRWLAEQHAIGLSHGDLKGGNIRLERSPEAIRFWLVDLQDLRGPGTLSERARIEALSQLNASLADEAFDAKSRRAGLAAYAERLAFSRPLDEVAHEIARRSVARDHRFRAQDCASLGTP